MTELRNAQFNVAAVVCARDQRELFANGRVDVLLGLRHPHDRIVKVLEKRLGQLFARAYRRVITRERVRSRRVLIFHAPGLTKNLESLRSSERSQTLKLRCERHYLAHDCQGGGASV